MVCGMSHTFCYWVFHKPKRLDYHRKREIGPFNPKKAWKFDKRLKTGGALVAGREQLLWKGQKRFDKGEKKEKKDFLLIVL